MAALMNKNVYILINIYIYICDKFVVKNGHQRYMFYDEIGVCTHNIEINLS